MPRPPQPGSGLKPAATTRPRQRGPGCSNAESCARCCWRDSARCGHDGHPEHRRDDPAAAGIDCAEHRADEAAISSSTAGVTHNTAVKDAPVDAGTYGVRLRDLEQRINELKEQIFRSKARLSLLAETVLQGVVAGAKRASSTRTRWATRTSW